jgi:hypothetical protein
MDAGGLVWFLAIVGGTTLLGLAFAYGVAQWGRRDRRLDHVRDSVTVQNYRAEDERERGGETR